MEDLHKYILVNISSNKGELLDEQVRKLQVYITRYTKKVSISLLVGQIKENSDKNVLFSCYTCSLVYA